MSCFVEPRVFKGRQGIAIGNDKIVATVLCGGGHIALIQTRADSDKGFESSPLPLAWYSWQQQR